jgi:hypothetical protein
MDRSILKRILDTMAMYSLFRVEDNGPIPSRDGYLVQRKTRNLWIIAWRRSAHLHCTETGSDFTTPFSNTLFLLSRIIDFLSPMN